jgi:hypothetical protein
MIDHKCKRENLTFDEIKVGKEMQGENSTYTTFLVISLSFRAFKAGSRSAFSKLAFPAILKNM